MLARPLRRSASGSTPCSTAPRPRWLALPMLVVGVAAALAGLLQRRAAGRPHPLPPRPVALARDVVGGASAGRRRRWLVWWVSEHQLAIAYPLADALPPVSA